MHTRSHWLTIATAALVTVLVGFTSSYAIVVQAGQAMGMDRDHIISMTIVLCIGMGLTTLLPSLWLRMPIVTAWSTPGAALLAVTVHQGGLPSAIGAFVVCGALLTLVGITGWFERGMHRIPTALASALLAGVLVKFALETFMGLQSALPIVGSMVATYLIGKRLTPRFVVPWVLVIGVGVTAGCGRLIMPDAVTVMGLPVWTSPDFDLTAIISIALPLFVVTMASQNVPGVAVLKAFQYPAPISKIVTLTGLATLVLAPFGAFGLNLAAITAALCMGAEVHPDANRRYLAAVGAGSLYLVLALLAPMIVDVFRAFPRELIISIAGLALLPTIGRGLAAALHNEHDREPALMAFLVTASGVTLLGIGSAFWGAVIGSLAHWIMKRGNKQTT
ncbi:benzoate membrane transport protein [Chitinivorax tropicus]|uniref:Benzoate membrane transport protein n=1 Tax=Chitinivorax tropicus TaxID=714531 RepID=A0A840MKN3_9PROT|nr:benzoate/H(+) symporter BenE family transporter [Chitinivorax tropicus]MBB5017272.1 benzoate membrane transport protein [Chitinivorax tropicus]